MRDIYLRAASEPELYAALEAAGVASVQWLGRGEPVTDAALIAELDAQPVDADLSCEYQGRHYAARDGQWLVLLPTAVAAPGYALDVIGAISKQVGGTDDEPVVRQLPGFHANLRGELTDEQTAKLPVIPVPQSPARVWA
jgi:hypothetical protein